jgi:hypothetical protein
MGGLSAWQLRSCFSAYLKHRDLEHSHTFESVVREAVEREGGVEAFGERRLTMLQLMRRPSSPGWPKTYTSTNAIKSAAPWISLALVFSCALIHSRAGFKLRDLNLGIELGQLARIYSLN